jgi:hypothetical protein
MCTESGTTGGADAEFSPDAHAAAKANGARRTVSERRRAAGDGLYMVLIGVEAWDVRVSTKV